jgi:hypothetical protein
MRFPPVLLSRGQNGGARGVHRARIAAEQTGDGRLAEELFDDRGHV